MADYTNTGSLSRNKDKQQQNHADYNGKCNVDGKEYFINGWIKTRQDGSNWLSLSFKSIQARQQQQQKPQQQRTQNEPDLGF